jgi:ABC-2 type transport system permease protein
MNPNRQRLEKIRVIAAHEFIKTVTRRTYLVVTLGMPIMLFGVFAVEMFLVTKVTQRELATAAAVVDRSGLARLDAIGQPAPNLTLPVRGMERLSEQVAELKPYENLERALADMKKGDLFACYLIDADYLQTGRVTCYVRESRIGAAKTMMSEQSLVRALRAGLLEGRVPEDIRERALYPARFDRMEVAAEGHVKPEPSPTEKLYSMLAPIMLCGLLTSSIFMSAGYLTQSMIGEHQNRVMEVLLSSVQPIELLFGKMFGLGAAGLIPAMIYGAIPTLALLPYFATQGWRLVVLSAVYVLLGYVLYATLLTATGVIANGMREGNQLATIWTTISAAPAIVFVLSSDMNSWLARTLSWFPPTAPTSMLIRLCYTKVAAWDVLISLVSLIGGIFLALRFLLRIFRTTSLMYGKRLRLSELRRWLREA